MIDKMIYSPNPKLIKHERFLSAMQKEAPGYDFIKRKY